MRGEDYDFQFSGRVREGKLQCRLNLEYVGDDSQQETELTEPEKQRCAHFLGHCLDCCRARQCLDTSIFMEKSTIVNSILESSAPAQCGN